MKQDEMYEHVVRMGEVRNVCKIWVGTPEEKNHLEDLGVDGSLMLECMSGK